MNRAKQILLTILIVSLLLGCDNFKNTLSYKEKTKDLIETLSKEDYDKAVDHFALEHEMFKNTDIDAFKKSLLDFRQHIKKNFGTDLNYSLMKAEKKISTRKEENTPPKTTIALIQFSNEKEFGVFRVLFDDTSGKIINLNILDVKHPIPSMTFFWLFGILAIFVPIFNIYVIRLIKRSNLKRKWLKYIGVILLNVPAITYASIQGLSFKLLSFQIMLGLSFEFAGFLNSYWTFGIPLGGLYWFWKLKLRKNKEKEAVVAFSGQDSNNPNAESNEDNKPTTG
jgi:hypothetical protein